MLLSSRGRISKQLENSIVFCVKDTVSRSYWPVHKDCSQVTTAQDWSEMTDAPPTRINKTDVISTLKSSLTDNFQTACHSTRKCINQKQNMEFKGNGHP